MKDSSYLSFSYRRDTIDTTHFPVFHQMEGLHIIEEVSVSSSGYRLTLV